MASLNSDKVHKNLKKKGFIQSPGDHNFFEYYSGGKLIVTTRTSHNKQDIGDSLISAMSKQCKVKKDFFKEFISCTKSQSDYDKELKDQQLI